MRQFVTKPSLIAVSVIAVVAFVGGGIAHAATSSASIKVCVTSKNVVRSADAKGKCPKKTKAVAINKVGPAGRPGASGPAGAPGAAGALGKDGRDATQKLVASADPANASFPAFTRTQQPGTEGGRITVSKIDFTVATAGFYTFMATSDINGSDSDQVSCNDGTPFPQSPYTNVNADEQPVLDGFSPGRPSSSIEKWLEPGPHLFEAILQQGGCASNDFSGTVSLSNTHMRVYSN